MRNLNARKIVTFIQLNYATTNITTAAFVQLLASIPKGIAEIQIVNGSTSTLILATGTAGNEVGVMSIPPGGGNIIPFDDTLGKGTRLSAKAFDATASTGVLSINLFA